MLDDEGDEDDEPTDEPTEAPADEVADDPRRDSLLAQLIEHRDDPGLWTVLADHLQSVDDPRGALVALMMERERAPTPHLLAAERAYRARHGKALLPPTWRRHSERIAWERGFPVGIAVTSPEQLAEVIASPALRFVETVRAEVNGSDHDAWLEALGDARVAWRRLRLHVDGADEELVLAPWLAAAPALEQLRVIVSEYDEAVVSFDGARAPSLRLLVVENAVEVAGLDEAGFPALADLRLLGTTSAPEDLFDTELYARLERFVTNAADVVPELRDGPVVTRHEREEAEYGDDQQAFVVVRQLVDPSLVEDVARGLPGLRALHVQTGHVVDRGSSSLTIVRTYGSDAGSLMPYGLAIALAERLPAGTPCLLYHSSLRTQTERAFTLATQRRQVVPYDDGKLLRTLLDEQLGRDPGIDIFAEVFEALDCSPRTPVIGGSARVHLLTDIDPASLGPLPEYDDEFGDPDDSEYSEAAIDLYTPPAFVAIAREDDAPAEPLPLGEAVIELDRELELESAELEAEAETVTAEIGEHTDALRVDRSPDGRHAWIELLSIWAERERDPDDDHAPRFPDPELQWSEHVDIDTLPLPAVCHRCEIASELHACTRCGGQYCAACCALAASGGVWCLACVELLTCAPAADDLVPDDEDHDLDELDAANDSLEAEDDEAEDDWFD